MFHSARLKLTFWYLLIIMLISFVFSFVIYKGVTIELERGMRRSELRLKAEELGIRLPRQIPLRLEKLRPELKDINPRLFLLEDLKETKQRVRLYLLFVNGGIFVVSASAGYFLAGQTLKPIERAMEEQKRFVADASHELRTPLTALKTSMEVALRNKKMSLSESKKVIKSNLEDIDELQSLSNNLLSLANFQNNSHNLFFEDFDITLMVKRAYRKILSLAKKKKIDIRLKIKSQEIYANKESFEQMMLIFLDNAVKYTPESGEITITTESDRNNITVGIKDTGVGISKEDVPHIFDRFYRADQSRSKEQISGFGLGLSLAKRIIEIHKGSVKAESTLGKGTTFTIRLPLKHS